MTNSRTANFKLVAQLASLTLAWLAAAPALAQAPAVTPQQKATANQVAQGGVALSALAANAPESYSVKSGDTLWGIATLFLKSAWRWPELWGMNLADIKNPHLIYPGQKLHLEKKDGQAVLRLATGSAAGAANAQVDAATAELPPTVRWSPRTRYETLGSGAVPALKFHLIEPYLAEPVIVDESVMRSAPRIVATQEGRVLLTRGDRAYARGPAEAALTDDLNQKQQVYRIFREATPLKDPITGELLGLEAQYLGKALLARSETSEQSQDKDGKSRTDTIPATIDITAAKEEIRVGDRLLPEPARILLNYVPHAPQARTDARIVSVYGNAVVNAAQNQVVAINRGARDGIENGHVLAILKDGARLIDKTDEARTELKLPDERNGLLMVFKTFDRVSYALILEITDSARVGDRLVNPR
jgi:LysM repeat protein